MTAEQAFRRIAERRGFWAPVGWILSPLGLVYGTLAAVRRRLYETGKAARTRVPAVVVSVGNLEVGGVGKTPVTIWLAQELARQGMRTAVVAKDLNRSRRTPFDASRELMSNSNKLPSDEVILLTRSLRECSVYAGPDKTDAAVRAWEEARPEVIVVDDGFQHLRLCRDMEIVVLDFDHPLGRGGVLPAGTLREFPGTLTKADVFWINRVGTGRSGEWMGRALSAYNWRAAVVTSRLVPQGLRLPGGGMLAPSGLKVLAFCGIGSPDGFGRTLGEAGCEVLGLEVFPDHHRYSDDELDGLEKLRRERSADFLVTTGKDSVKLGRKGSELNIAFLEVSLEVSGEAERLLSEIRRLHASRFGSGGSSDHQV
jgi:tetraacyldisaccharide 4'-kinase